MLQKIVLFLGLCILGVFVNDTYQAEEICEKGEETFEKRYLLYDINPGEGFNLRRDVYLRVANIIYDLSKVEPWILVLPPWGNLYHWKRTPWDFFHPWEDFFDVKSLNKWISVMELKDFIKSEGNQLDSAIILQNYKNMWEEEWMERYEISDCQNQHSFQQNSAGLWNVDLWGTKLAFTNMSCLSYQGVAPNIIRFLTKDNKNAKSVYLDHSEILLHSEFGGWKYWKARRSMRFAPHLMVEAESFRRLHLNSDDLKDNTQISEDWRDFMPKVGSARGGPYVATHMRRRDFVTARKEEVPSIEDAVRQLTKILRKLNLRKLFVATDAPIHEIEELRTLFSDFEVFTYTPSPSFIARYGDGGMAVVEQIICAHARYFIGTHESTFSFRIQEEREILGFSSDTTFNRLCGQNLKCEQPVQWKIVYQ